MAVRVGLVGAGFAADIHARALAQLGDAAELVTVAAPSFERARAFAARHAIPEVTSDYQHVLERADVELVDACVPNALHEEVVVAAAQAGKHVICEKPLTGYFGGEGAADPVGATSKRVMLAGALASADRMLAAAQQAGVKLMYAENWLYCPAIAKIVELIETAGGTIFQIRAEESHSGSHAAYARMWSKAGGGALLRLGAHPIGGVLYLKQQEGLCRNGVPIRPASVMAEVGDLSRMQSFRSEPKHWVVDDWQDVENWSAVVITFQDGSRAVINASDVMLGGMEDTLEVCLSNARIKCDMTHSSLLHAFAPDPAVWGDTYIAEKVDHKGGWTYPSVDEHWMLGYPHELRDFVEAVALERAPRSTGELGREVVQVMYAAYLSAEEGRRVHLAPLEDQRR